MKLGLYSITYLGVWYRGPALTHEELIDRARQFGYEGIEIDGKRPHGNPLDLPAERCHELAYIAFGELLARGTAKEVVAQSGLSTWIVSGADLHRLATKLETCDGIDMVAPFGTELHVSGRDRHALDTAIDAAKKADGAHKWTRGEPSLEDVFILLMDKAKDNFA